MVEKELDEAIVEIATGEVIPAAFSPCLNSVNSWFNSNNPCYDNEKKLFSKLTAEALDHAGARADWYVVDYSLENERVFGEDNDRYVVANFPLKLYFEVPPSSRTYTQFGIEGVENYKVYIGKLAFSSYAKKYYGRDYKPMVGDLVRTKFDGIFYEVVSVLDTDNQFRNTQHSWTITLKPWENGMIKYREEVGVKNEEMKQTMDGENGIVECPPPELVSIKEYLDNGSDTLKQNEVIEEEKKKVMYEPLDPHDTSVDDPFGLNW